ncbi:apyrase-like [Cylas formicarius]|uniref:apyrase-like n=1 Tax=Cylas formicarius TaxID=197179 RepID=UPI002958B44E|nr:apyrase-like [Cylas formicarius]
MALLSSLFVAVAVNVAVIYAESFELSVIHVNDFHARYDEVSLAAGDCKTRGECIGGYSRIYAQIRELLQENPNSVLLNGGDNFQGTLYYTLGKWNITQEFLNLLPWDAIVLGNHEFDDKIAGVVPFIEALKAPVVVSNIDDSLEPTIQGLYTKSTVIERNGKKIGIIGVIYSQTNIIASSENLKFYPESPSVNEEAERLVREEGVFTNIVLSHSGYDIEQAIAANASEKIGLIVGAHSHTFLWTGADPPGPDTPEGPYPTVVKSKNNKTVLVVQASAYSKYLGNISVVYNDDGEIVDWSGAPIYLNTDKPTDDSIDKQLEPWKSIVEAEGSRVLGSSIVLLQKTGCYYKECTLGNFLADALVFQYTDRADATSWTYAAIALVNAGGIRTDIPVGNITYNDISIAQPFANTVDVGELEGRYLKELMEQCTEAYSNQRSYSDISLIQVSGIHVVFNLTRPKGDRVQSIKVRCQQCLTPVYEDLVLDKSYRIVAQSFLRSGGDGFSALSDNLKNTEIGPVDIDVYENYLRHRSPVFQEEEERIIVLSDSEIRYKMVD